MKKKIILGVLLFLVILSFIIWLVFGKYFNLLNAILEKDRAQIDYSIDSEKVNPNSWNVNLINYYMANFQNKEDIDLDFINYLIDKGIDVNYASDNHIPPINVAVIEGRTDLLRLLIKKGADVDILYKKRDVRPLDVAVIVKNCEAIRILEKAGAHFGKYENSLGMKIRLKKCYLEPYRMYELTWEERDKEWKKFEQSQMGH